MRVKETSGSEPLMTCRKGRDDVKTGRELLAQEKAWKEPVYWPGGVRHEGGVTWTQALVWNLGTCRPDGKGDIQVGGPH